MMLRKPPDALMGRVTPDESDIGVNQDIVCNNSNSDRIDTDGDDGV
jgi:hypothetical protein